MSLGQQKMSLLHELNSKKILKKKKKFWADKGSLLLYKSSAESREWCAPYSPPPPPMLRTIMPRACVLGDYATEVKKKKKKRCVGSNLRVENPAKT
jgi:hypothetical protein